MKPQWKSIDQESKNGMIFLVTDGKSRRFASYGEHGFWHNARNGINISAFYPTHYMHPFEVESLLDLPMLNIKNEAHNY